ncbi:MAG: hypothetical protein L6R41_006878 [Letrouitia leprolyta]|nr:MAG: hypothetical protein L6R41_006878 [Letrouitia leprolyta]
MTTTPIEDWILYPDEVVVTKHSSVKERRGNSEKSYSDSKVCSIKTTRPEMPPTPPGSNPASTEDERALKKTITYTRKAPQSTQGQPTSGAFIPPTLADGKARRGVSFHHRLPTPDISDVDEDEFWACCKNSNMKK